MYKNIVVGYDGTERALRAVDEASLLATAFGSTLHLVTAVSKDEIHEFGTGSDRIVKSDIELAKISLKKLARSYSHLNVTTAAVKSGAASALLSEAEAIDADVIVVGNKNVQGLSRVLGSIAEDVAHNAKCAVFIAQTSDKFAQIPAAV